MCTIKVNQDVFIYPGIVRQYELRWLDRVDGRAQLVTVSINFDGSLGDVGDSVEFYSLIGQTRDEVRGEMQRQLENADLKPHLTQRDEALPCTCITMKAAA